jgi:hypothetical protein
MASCAGTPNPPSRFRQAGVMLKRNQIYLARERFLYRKHCNHNTFAAIREYWYFANAAVRKTIAGS